MKIVSTIKPVSELRSNRNIVIKPANAFSNDNMMNKGQENELYTKMITFKEEVQVHMVPRVYEATRRDFFYTEDELERFLHEACKDPNTAQYYMYGNCPPPSHELFDDSSYDDSYNHHFHPNRTVGECEEHYCYDEYQQCHDGSNPYTRQTVGEGDKVEFPKTVFSPKLAVCRKKKNHSTRMRVQKEEPSRAAQSQGSDWAHWY